MRTAYEIRTGRRLVSLQLVSLQNGPTHHEALIEYLRGSGCHVDEIVRLGTETLAWRGAVYTAVAVGGQAQG